MPDPTRPRRDRSGTVPDPDVTPAAGLPNEVPKEREAILAGEETRTLPLREEELVARKQMREVGEVVVHKEVEEVPGRLEVDAIREQVEITHVPIGRAVEARREPWQDGDTYVMPVYEEQMVLVKRLVLKEEVRMRRVATTERQLFEDTLRRERPVVEDSTGRVAQERYPTDDEGAVARTGDETTKDPDKGGPLERIARKLLD